MAAPQGMKRFRSDIAGELGQQLSKRTRRLSTSLHKKILQVAGDAISPSATTGQSKPPTPLTLFTLLVENRPIHVALVSKLSYNDFYALCDSSPAFKMLLLGRRFDVNRKLERFFDDPKALRAAMAVSAALLSGYFVLQLFAGKVGKEWLQHPLEFFVMTGPNETLLRQHLSSEQYICTLAHVRSTQDRQRQKIIETRTYERTTSRFGKTVLKVHTTEQHPLFSIITSAYFTTDLNIMSWNKAYALFEHETFTQHKMYLLGHLTNAAGAVSKTYEKLGWSTTDIMVMSNRFGAPTLEHLGSGSTSPAITLLGYSFSVKMDHQVTFNDMRVPDAVPDSVLENCRFGFKQEVGSGGMYIEANIAAFDHPLLEYNYTRAPYDDWDWVARRLMTMVPFELAKLDPAMRPKGVLSELSDGDLVMNDARHPVWKWTKETKPESWNFMDQHVFEWLRMVAEERARIYAEESARSQS